MERQSWWLGEGLKSGGRRSGVHKRKGESKGHRPEGGHRGRRSRREGGQRHPDGIQAEGEKARSEGDGSGKTRTESH